MAKTTFRATVAIGEALAPVGELVLEADGRRQTSMFRYADAWLDNPTGHAIAPAMPLSTTPFFTSATAENSRTALPLPVGDRTPDSWGRGLMRRGERRSLTEFDYLVLETGISELSGHAASIEAALEAAPFFDIDRDEARSMLASMVAVIDDRWRQRCREAGLSAAEIAHYGPAFEHEETKVGRRLAGI